MSFKKLSQVNVVQPCAWCKGFWGDGWGLLDIGSSSFPKSRLLLRSSLLPRVTTLFLPLNRFVQSLLNCCFPHSFIDILLKLIGPCSISVREPRVKPMNTRTARRRQSWAIPKRFSSTTYCCITKQKFNNDETGGRKQLTSSDKFSIRERRSWYSISNWYRCISQSSRVRWCINVCARLYILRKRWKRNSAKESFVLSHPYHECK